MVLQIRHGVAALLVVLAVLVGAACGGGRDGARDDAAARRGPHFTTAQVQRAFRAATGYGLRVDPIVRSSFGDRDLLRPAGGEAGFGRFTVVVADEPGALRIAAQPDERGIAWVYSEEEGSWVATTRYGDNVFLSWLAGDRERTDARWARVDHALATLAPRARTEN
jgi:hypothetical protein